LKFKGSIASVVMELSNGKEKEEGGRKERGGGNVGGGRARLPAIAIIKRGDIWRGSMLVRGAKKALTSQHDYNILS